MAAAGIKAGTVTETMDAAGYTYLQIDTGEETFWAAAPSIEIEVGDGTKRRLGTGEILLAEDTTGRGHISRAVGARPRKSILVTLE